MTVDEILESWLKEHGYDGLIGDECGCEIGDLVPCDCWPSDCQPGYKHECPGKDGCKFPIEWCDGADWCMQPTKQE